MCQINSVIIVPYAEAKISEDSVKETLETSLLMRFVNIS